MGEDKKTDLNDYLIVSIGLLMALLVFGIILSILVLVHEFGHYFVAKKMGVKVEEFGLGIPPRLIGKTNR
jgi:regulator of sigma E protease